MGGEAAYFVVGKPEERRALRADLVGTRLELGRAAHLGLGEEPVAVCEGEGQEREQPAGTGTGRPGADGAVQSGSMGVAHSEHRG